jgi:hypothetical protein
MSFATCRSTAEAYAGSAAAALDLGAAGFAGGSAQISAAHHRTAIGDDRLFLADFVAKIV